MLKLTLCKFAHIHWRHEYNRFSAQSFLVLFGPSHDCKFPGTNQLHSFIESAVLDGEAVWNAGRGNRWVVAACAPGLSGPYGTALAARRILTGPASQYILYWTASIGHPRQSLPAWLYLLHPCSRARSPLIRQPTRRFDVAQPATIHRLPSNEGAIFSVWKLNSPG
jgi:hypothetical protein